jgi:hypothetical protein
MTLRFSRQTFEKSSYMKYNENPYSGSQVVPRGQTDGKTDTMKLFAVLRTHLKTRQFINIPKFPSDNVKQHEYDGIN